MQHLQKEKLSGWFFLWFEKQIDAFASLLHAILLKALRHKAITFGFVTALFFRSIMLIPAGFVGTEVFGIGDAGEFILGVELPKDITLKETNLKVLEIEHFLTAKPEIKSVFTTVGSSSSGMQSGGPQNNSNKAEINIKLTDKEFRKVSSTVYANQIKNLLNAKLTGVKVTAAILNPNRYKLEDVSSLTFINTANKQVKL